MPAFADAEGSGISGFDYTNYTEVEYIQSSGTQYINTGLNSTDGYNYEFKVNYLSSNGAVFGRATSYRNDYFYVNSSLVAKYNCRNKDTTISNISLNTDYILTAGSVLNNSYASINNENVSISTNTNTIIDKNVYLFAYINGSNQISWKSSMKMYYGKIWNSSDQLVAYYVPAKRKADNVVGLYDVVSSTFLQNSGSGSFTAGQEVNVSYNVSISLYPSSNAGSVTGAGSYLANSTATLTATANQGYEFSKWTVNGSDYSTSNPLNIIVQSDISLTAQFLPTLITETYLVSASVSPAGSGVVNGAGEYQDGSEVTLTAVPSSGFVFDHWDNGSSVNPLVFTVSSDVSRTAYFVQESQVTTYNVSITVDPNNSGSVTGGGVLQAGTTTNLTASPLANYQFEGWYENNNLLSRSNPFSLLVDRNYSITAKFSEQQINTGWVDWTDENDTISYINITDQFTNSEFSFQIIKRLVIDNLEWESDQGVFRSNSDREFHFAGYYYDNSIYGITACNSTTTSHTSSSIQQVSSDTIFVNLDYTGEFNVIPDTYFGLSLGNEAGLVSQMSGVSTSSTFQNTSEACQIMGTNPGDSTLDGSMLYDLGYTAIGLESDIEGVEATIFVPGQEALSFSSSDLGMIFEGVKQIMTNVYHYTYHYEYDVYLFGSYNSRLPEFGKLETKLSMYQLLNYGNWIDYSNSDFKDFMYERYTVLPGSSGVDSIGQFRYWITNIEGDDYYNGNYTNLYWSGTDMPEWHFKTQEYRGNFSNRSEYVGSFNVGGMFYSDVSTNHINNYYLDTLENDSSIVITPAMAANNINFTAGVNMFVNAFKFTFYKENNNSLLNRFNQLGSFLNGWFNRIYNSISNITGGSESNDITQNITNDYNIDVDTDINNVITNIQDRDGDINLQSPDFQISNNDITGLQLLSDIPSETIKVFTDNHIAILIFIPIIFGILRLIL